MEKLIHEQHRMLRYVHFEHTSQSQRASNVILREEYELHEEQIDLICSTLSDKTDSSSVAARECLTKIKKDMFKPYKP